MANWRVKLQSTDSSTAHGLPVGIEILIGVHNGRAIATETFDHEWAIARDPHRSSEPEVIATSPVIVD